MGLQRAFVLAGAQSLLMSLWRIAEQPRLQLLEDFYRRILAGLLRREEMLDEEDIGAQKK